MSTRAPAAPPVAPAVEPLALDLLEHAAANTVSLVASAHAPNPRGVGQFLKSQPKRCRASLGTLVSQVKYQK
jgi:hypothetical protein